MNEKRLGNKKTNHAISMVFVYVLLILIAFLMLIPFAWMLSASLKMNKDVFSFPIKWIPENPRWRNYVDIWTKIPLRLEMLPASPGQCKFIPEIEKQQDGCHDRSGHADQRSRHRRGADILGGDNVVQLCPAGQHGQRERAGCRHDARRDQFAGQVRFFEGGQKDGIAKHCTPEEIEGYYKVTHYRTEYFEKELADQKKAYAEYKRTQAKKMSLSKSALAA